MSKPAYRLEGTPKQLKQLKVWAAQSKCKTIKAFIFQAAKEKADRDGKK